ALPARGSCLATRHDGPVHTPAGRYKEWPNFDKWLSPASSPARGLSSRSDNFAPTPSEFVSHVRRDNRSEMIEAQQLGQPAGVNLVVLVAFPHGLVFPRIAHHQLRDVRFQ